MFWICSADTASNYNTIEYGWDVQNIYAVDWLIIFILDFTPSVYSIGVKSGCSL